MRVVIFRSFVIALIVAGILLSIWNYGKNWYRAKLMESERQAVYHALLPKGNLLYKSINREFLVINGLVAFVESESDSFELKNHFNSFAAGLLSGIHSIRVVQVFLSDIPVLVYPVKGNEAVIGRRLNDLINDERAHVRRDVRRALETRGLTLSHPYQLRQGGMGIVARRPVFENDALRAIVTVILDIPAIVKNAGITGDGADVTLAVGDEDGHIFWGDETLFDKDPVLYQVTMPEGEWLLLGVKKGGWRSGIVSPIWWYETIGLLLVLALSALVYWISVRQSILSRRAARQAEYLKEERIRRAQAEEWIKIAVSSANIGFWDLDLVTHTTTFSSGWKSQIGYRDDEIADDFVEWEKRIHPDDAEWCMKTISGHLEDPKPNLKMEYRFRHREGHYLWILSQASIIYDAQNQPIRLLGFHIDITERKRHEEAIEKRVRFYAISDRINHILQKESRPDRFWELSCQAILEEGGYRLVFFAAPDEPGGRLEPVTWVGVTRNELEELTAQQRLGQCPMDKAYQTGLPVVGNDINTDAAVLTWRPNAQRLKCRSFAALPIEVDGKSGGVLNLYTGAPFFFDDEETRHTTDLAQALSLALKALNQAEQRQQAEKALRQSEALLRQTGHIAKIGGWEFNAVTLEGTWTEEVARIHDLDPTEKTSVAIGLSHYEGEYREMMERAVRDATKSGIPYDLEVELVSAKGVKKWVRAIARPEVVDGKVVRVSGAFQDISDRKAAEYALRDSEERFRTAFESSASGVCLTSLDGYYIKVNPRMCAMLGYQREELEGVVHFNQLTHPDDLSLGRDATQKMLAGEIQTVSLEKRYLQKNGQIVWVNMNIGLIKDNAGRPQNFITQLNDITPRKMSEEALKQYHERLSILRDIDMSIILSRSSPEMINSVLAKIKTLIPCRRITFLLMNEDSPGGRFFSVEPDTTPLTSTPDTLSVPNDLFELLKTGNIVKIDDYRALSPGDFSLGDKFATAGLTTSLFVPLVFTGDLAGILHLGHDQRGFFTDLHEEMIEDVSNKLAVALNQYWLREKIQRQNEELEGKIQARTAELEAKNKELETFAYSVSHDLKAPLRGIDGYSRLLQEDYAGSLGEEGLIFVNNVRQATIQMAQLIDDLLAYSRIERRAWNQVSIDLKETVEKILAGYVDEIAERRVMIDTKNIPATVNTDPDGLKMILRNLLANALKFTRDVPSPSIEIGGEENEAAIILWVRDNGIGFKMGFHNLIFEIFQRLHRAEEYPGTGVGLAIARKAVERMNGRIWAESEPGKGAAFYIEIPRQS